MNNLELLKAIQKIAFEITNGDPQRVDFTCPNCGYSPIIFSFALNRPPKVGLYINCRICGLLHHFYLLSKPPNFRAELILPEYQELEDEAMLFADNLGEPRLDDNEDR